MSTPIPPYTEEEKKLLKTYPHFFDPLDDEEAELMDAIRAGKLQKDDQSIHDTMIQSAITQARADMKKSRTMISLRTNTSTLTTIKNFAKKQKIPYQKLINAYLDEMAHKMSNIQ